MASPARVAAGASIVLMRMVNLPAPVAESRTRKAAVPQREYHKAHQQLELTGQMEILTAAAEAAEVVAHPLMPPHPLAEMAA